MVITSAALCEPGGDWILLIPAAEVPEAWASRGVAMVAVAVESADALTATRSRSSRVAPQLSPLDEDILRGVRGGVPLARVARDVGLGLRQVHRRLAKLRKTYGVTTNAALVAQLAGQADDANMPPDVAGMTSRKGE